MKLLFDKIKKKLSKNNRILSIITSNELDSLCSTKILSVN